MSRIRIISYTYIHVPTHSTDVLVLSATIVHSFLCVTQYMHVVHGHAWQGWTVVPAGGGGDFLELRIPDFAV